jgi:hypothetical protein
LARNNHIFNSFIAGEVSPKFFGRTNTQPYPDGCEELRNVIPFTQGGATKSPGTLFKYRVFKKDEVSNPAQVRLIPFYGTDGSRWQLIITDETPLLVEAPLVAGSPTPVPASTSSWRAYNIDTGELSALVQYDWAGTNITQFETEYNLGSSGRDIVLNEIQYAQSGDTCVAVHGKFRPMLIKYDPTENFLGCKFYFEPFPRPFGASTGFGVTGAYYAEFPFLPLNTFMSEGTFTMAVDLNLAADSPDGGNNNAKIDFTFFDTTIVLDNTWIGRVLRGSQDAKTISLQIYEIVDSNTANARVIAGALDADPTTFLSSEIELGAWDTKHGFPRSVAFFDSRLVFGGTDYFPDQIWFSKLNNIKWYMSRLLEQDPDFTDPITNADTFSVTLKQNIYSKIQWLSPGKNLTAGTNSGEFIVKGPDTTQVIGALNVSSDVETPHGSAYIQSIKNENTTIFVQRNRKWLRELVFNLDENSFIAPNLNILNPDIAAKFGLERADDEEDLAITPGAFVAMVKQEVPWQIVWCLDNNGALLGVVRDRTQNVVAWCTRELAGVRTISDIIYRPKIKSISSIQKSALDEFGTGGEPDELWMAVSRRYDGADAFYLEKLMPEWEYGKIQNNWNFDDDVAPVYLDMCVFRDSANGPSEFDAGLVTLDHLEEGQVVGVVKDGFWLGEFTVNSDQQIDISAHCSQEELDGDVDLKLLVGFNFLGRLNPLPPEVPARLGTSMGNLRRIDRITINFFRSIGCRFGRYTDDLQENTPVSPLEEVNFPLDPNQGPTPLFSGEKVLDFPQGWETRPRVLIEFHLPFPATVTHMTARMNVSE